MQPSPYDRTMKVLRTRFRRQPVASTALALACAWIAVNVYETAAHWHTSAGLGWFLTVADAVSLCATGIFGVAALSWLVERVFRETES